MWHGPKTYEEAHMSVPAMALAMVSTRILQLAGNLRVWSYDLEQVRLDPASASL